MKPYDELSDDEKKKRREDLGAIFETTLRQAKPSPEKKLQAEETKPPNFAAMLNSIIDWKLDGLRKELTTPGTIPWPKVGEATAWIASNCPTLYQYMPRLEVAKILERTSEGFNVKCQQAAFACLLGKCGFQNWKDLGKYFRINGLQAKGNSLKNQASPGKYPRGWHRIKAVLPELK